MSDVHVYKWDDADAPVLNSDGPGAMANLLRKCLVDGYGSGDQEKAPAGWTMDWDSDTNARVALRPGAVEAQTCHYYVDDTGTVGAGGNRWARIWISENWDGWDENGDPVDALIPDDTDWGRTIAKNVDDQNSTPVPWIIVATDMGFYLLVDYYYKEPGFDGNNGAPLAFCGRAISYGGSDDYLDVLSFGNSEDYTSTRIAYYGTLGSPRWWDQGTGASPALARRAFDGISTNSVIATRCGAGGTDNDENFMGRSPSIPHPEPISGATLTARVLITQGNPRLGQTLIRGNYPGILWPLHQAPFSHGEIVEVNGRQYIALNMAVNVIDVGQALVDIEGPWE
ncbi:hypothetical protein [Thioalkalivibrio sp. ALJ8]|uniref:hypothetical protein n=1 Tax=Thioalkalivibrio sp. ALJ8 TaxID=1158757 RepID=UPI0012DDCBDC|nr:hypothetical protein [Thioalkalivibrio sp. ALJ8]